jgi:opacity protein-like surface antigen
MCNRFMTRISIFSRAGILACIVIAALPLAQAQAIDLLGIYVGGAVGQGRVEANNLSSPSAVVPTLGEFKENHSAYKVMIGVRPISIIGAELAYVDFGHPSGAVGTGGVATIGAANVTASADVTLKGPAAFAMLYLPIPIVDVYLKAGEARLQTTANATVTLTGPILCVVGHPTCQFSQSNSTTNTGFAAGIGAQFKLGPAAVRGEYERFNAAGGNPGLFSLGLTWTF